MPRVFRASEHVLAVEGIQIHHVEAALVEGVRDALRDLSEQRRISIRREQAEALLHVAYLCATVVSGWGRAKGASCAAREAVWRLLVDVAERNQLLVHLQHQAVPDSEAGHRRHVLRGLNHA